jgi:hypothetical protein
MSSNEILVVGDLNIHMDNASDTAAGRLQSVLQSFGFTQHVEGATHQSGHTLDLISSRFAQLSGSMADTDFTVSSDHACVLFTVLDMPRPKKVLTEIQTRKTRSIDRNAFFAALMDSLSPDALLSLSCAEACRHHEGKDE